MAGSIAIQLGYKFAVLALAHPRVRSQFGPLVATDDGLAITNSLPEGALETWQESLGTFHQRELAETSLFLWATAESSSPDVLDDENERLRRRVYEFYLGLNVAVPYFSCGRITSLTGANSFDVGRVRSLTTYPQTFHVLGAPEPHLTVQRVKLAGTLANAIAKHHALYGQSRFTRCLRTFREATEASGLDHKLHQFARCAEGFACPPMRQSGKEFAKRLSRVCAGQARRQLEQIYTLRGGIEHLHGPYDRIPRMSQRQKWIRLLVRALEAESMARYLILSYLSNEALWPHFQTRDGIDAFWTLPNRPFRRLWSTKIAFSSIAPTLRLSALRAHPNDLSIS